MSTQAGMSHVHAVVVGCEKYARAGWDLSGPAFDAIEVARWLLALGMPPAQLHFMAVPKSANQSDFDLEKAKLQGIVDHGEPGSSKVKEVFITRLIRKINATSGSEAKGLLFVYWAGHGALHRPGHERERVVFCSDASAASCEALGLNQLSDWLANQLPNFRFAFVVDACALDATQLKIDDDIALLGLPRGGIRSMPMRLFAYAAAPGQAARNMQAIRSGLFTSRLLAQLANFKPQSIDQFAAIDEVLAQTREQVRALPNVYQNIVWSLESWDGVQFLGTARPANASASLGNAQAVEIAETAVYLCDRGKQIVAFRAIAEAHFKDKPTRPLIVISHGGVDQDPEAFIDSLRLRIAEAPSKWNACASLKAAELGIEREPAMTAELIKEGIEYKLAKDLCLPPGATMYDMANRIQSFNYATLLHFCFSSQALRGDVKQRLAPIWDYWRTFPDIAKGACVIVVIHITYPRQASGIFASLRDKFRDHPDSALQTYVNTFSAPPADATLGINSIKEALSSATLADLDDWRSSIRDRYRNAQRIQPAHLAAVMDMDPQPMGLVIGKLRSLINRLNQ